MTRGRYAFFLIPILAGCASYQAKPLKPADSAAAFERRSLADEGLKRFAVERSSAAAWPPGAWDVGALATVALYYSPDLDLARAQWATASAGRRTASHRPNPTLNGGPFEYVSNESFGTSRWVGGLALDVTLETADKRGIRMFRAAAAQEEARLNLASAAWLARSRARAATLGLWASQESESVLTHQFSELDTNERLLTGRANRGESSPFNAAQAVLITDKSRLALEDERRRQVDARARLAQALALPLAAVQDVALSSAAFAQPPSPEDPSFQALRREALLGRPALLAVLARYAQAEADLRLEIARQYPDVHLAPGYTYDQGSDKWGIGFSLPIPLFNLNQGPIAEAESRRAEAGARFLQLQAEILNDLDAALAAYRAAWHRLGVADLALKRHREQDAVLREILRPGDVSRLTLFRSQLDLDSTRLARVQALVDAQQALGALEDALERPLAGPPLEPALYERAPAEAR